MVAQRSEAKPVASSDKRRAQLAGQRQAIDDALRELDDIMAQAHAALGTEAARARRAAG